MPTPEAKLERATAALKAIDAHLEDLVEGISGLVVREVKRERWKLWVPIALNAVATIAVLITLWVLVGIARTNEENGEVARENSRGVEKIVDADPEWVEKLIREFRRQQGGG